MFASSLWPHPFQIHLRDGVRAIRTKASPLFCWPRSFAGFLFAPSRGTNIGAILIPSLTVGDTRRHASALDCHCLIWAMFSPHPTQPHTNRRDQSNHFVSPSLPRWAMVVAAQVGKGFRSPFFNALTATAAQHPPQEKSGRREGSVR